MSVQSPLNNSFQLLFISLSLFSFPCFSQDFYRGIEDAHTNATNHGLYEIREEARKFVKQENEKNHTRWEAGDPNLKFVVSRCIVPLKTMWAPKDRGLSNKSVWVICEKTADKYEKNWKVPVPVASPGDEGCDVSSKKGP
ncbi:hypothetical protein [Collimonas silvisoli]|uniref:hypothetical protein n=1 Tax=Collimonas silvisoli TaxID=2825884 RepID=UPI001B8C9602|nr:hypothetical protein [Collimonas silvisoli]